ncbi:hypothetical protein FNJ47_47135, partial [Bradyrhizobium sp. UFLA 03-164]|nr:hypothetical protein [Bradyrhizobium uaiense]
AGRGPLSRPVVAAPVALDPNRVPRGLDDSKRLTADRRAVSFAQLCATPAFSVAGASPAPFARDHITVSYTQLTLPTNNAEEGSMAAASTNKTQPTSALVETSEEADI